jgi:ABC-2 type transport system permease protein
MSARIANGHERPVIAVVSTKADYQRLSDARDEMADALGETAVVKIAHFDPKPDEAAQVKQLLSSKALPVRAVLTGGLSQPHLTGPVSADRTTNGQLRLLIANARSSQEQAPALDVTSVEASSGSLASDRAVTAQIAQTLLFVLCILLSGMLMSQLIEEKSNKIIEVIAAAIPIDAMFVGKLFAMLAASVTGLIVWVSAGALLVQMIKHGGVATLPTPAVGWPTFLVLTIAYFGMNYLLLGAAFLTIGAQASTAREVQTMSMPVTFGQMLLLLLASTAIGAPDSAQGIFAAVFPLSSPLTMIARAAEQPELWPHLVALLWQALWVGIILRVGSQLFRKTVLKSGPRRPWWKLGRA